jgi:DNA-3-methyladenine glycosylase
MFGPAAAVHLRSHGIHVCANVVCGYDGVAGAVLLRAAAVESGHRDRATPPRRFGSPGALARAWQPMLGVGITMDDNGIDLFDTAARYS